MAKQGASYEDIIKEEGEEEQEEPKKGSRGSSDLHLPFGLCARYGIPLPEGATPRIAWEALKRRLGLEPEDVFEELEENGEVDGLDQEVGVDNPIEPKENKEEPKEPIKPRKQLNLEESAPEFLSGNSRTRKQTEMLYSKINSLEGSNPDSVELFGLMKQANKYKYCKITYTGSLAKGVTEYMTKGFLSTELFPTNVTIPNLKNMTDNDAAYGTCVHEYSHWLDASIANSRHFSDTYKPLVDAINEEKDLPISKGLDELLRNKDREINSMGLNQDEKRRYNEAKDRMNDFLNKRDWRNYDAADKEKTKIWRNARVRISNEAYKVMDGWDAVEDILGGMVTQRVYTYGHSHSQYGNGRAEIFANYMDLSIMHPDKLEVLRKEKPKTVAALESMVKEMIAKVKSKQ